MLTVDFDRLDVQPGHRFLDLGCGAGRHSFEALRRGAHTTSLDYSASDLKGVKDLMWALVDAGDAPKTASFGVLQGDALNLAFDDNTFDRIIISEVLEHIQDDAAALAEVTRVLKPGGILAATVPAWGPEKVCWALSAEYHAPLSVGGHVRIYTETELKTRISDAGLHPTTSSWCGTSCLRQRSPAPPNASSTRFWARASWCTPKSRRPPTARKPRRPRHDHVVVS